MRQVSERKRRSNDRCCERLTGRLWPILLKNSLDKPLAYRRNAIFSVLA